MADQFTVDYSLFNDEVFILERRIDVAAQIKSVLLDALKNKNPKKLKLLEIGTSSGLIGSLLSDTFGEVVGIDVDKNASKYWKKNKKKNVSFKLMDAQKMKFSANTFDVVVTNQDYECLPDAQKMMDEIYRVLKPGGICFLGARNKITFIEGQYRVPFLSLFPEKAAHVYLKMLHRDNIFLARYKTYWGLRKMCHKFQITDYTLKVLTQSKKFKYKKLMKYQSITNSIPGPLLKMFEPIIPNFIFILQKPRG